LTQNFFCQPACDLETIREYVFFVAYCGKGGYTTDGAYQMPLDELVWHAKKLHEQLKEEKAVSDRQAAKMRQQQASSRARAKFRSVRR
jgi:hypothetical protein